MIRLSVDFLKMMTMHFRVVKKFLPYVWSPRLVNIATHFLNGDTHSNLPENNPGRSSTFTLAGRETDIIPTSMLMSTTY